MTAKQILTRALPVPASQDVERRYQEFIASTDSLDSHGSIVRQNWVLDRFRSNPIVLWMHDKKAPIGTGEVRVENGALVIGVTFATGTDRADEAWSLVQQGVVRAVSVGFVPGDYDIKELDDGSLVIVYDAPELFEVSVVSIPSNPDSLARAYAESTDAEQDIRRAVVARRAAQEKTSMATETQKPATPSETAPAAAETRAAEPINKEAHDLVVKSLHQTIAERDVALAKISAERDALLAENATAKADKLETKVRAFVGKKLTEANVEKFVNLARKSEEAFDAAIEEMPDLGFRPGEQVAKSDGRSDRGATDNERLAKRAAERKREFGEDDFAAYMGAAKDLSLKS